MLRLKHRWFCLKYDIRYWYYRIMYGVKVDLAFGTMFAKFGRGVFVDVLRNGPYIEITSHAGKTWMGIPRGTIRLIPYQPNHGVMVEYVHPNGTVGGRVHCSYDKFYEMVIGLSEKKADEA